MTHTTLLTIAYNRYMKECYFPIQEAERLCDGDAHIKIEVEVLTEDVYLHTCVAESSMARATGKYFTHQIDRLPLILTVLSIFHIHCNS